MARSPIVPTNLHDPTGTAPAERKAMLDMTRRLRKCRNAYLDLLGQLEFTEIATNARYEFRTLPSILSQLLEATSALIDSFLLEGGERGLWFSVGYVIPAYEKGAAMAWRNLGVQSTEYALMRPSLQSLLFSEPYQSRIGLVRAREFEQMKGLAGNVKSTLSQTLTQGLASGASPRDISRRITDATGIEEVRANRIARTEINQALRTARIDETRDATVRLKLKVKSMHLSALSPTTRMEHAARHGRLYPVEEEAAWFGEDGNAINCKCSVTEVLVDDKGEPLSKGLIDRTARAREKWEAAQEKAE